MVHCFVVPSRVISLVPLKKSNKKKKFTSLSLYFLKRINNNVGRSLSFVVSVFLFTEYFQ